MRSLLVLRLLLFLGLTVASTASAQTLTTIDITGPTSIVAGGGRVVYRATGTYTGGATANLSNSLKWSSSDPKVIKFNDATTPVATTGGAGTAIIWASDPSSPASGKLNVTVTEAPALPALSSFAFSPPDLTVVSGQTLTPIILGTYGVGSAATIEQIPANVPAWSTPNPTSAATITSGVITGGAVTGSSPITATVDVTIPPLAAKQVSITVTPAAAPPAGGASTTNITGGLTQFSKTILVNGAAAHNIALFLMPPPTPPATAITCSLATVETAAPIAFVTSSATAAAVTTANTFTLPSTAPPFAVPLAQSLSKGEVFCVEDLGVTPTTPGAAPPAPAMPTTVPAIVGAAIQTPTAPILVSKLVAGNRSLTVQGNAGDTVSVYQLDPGYNLDQPCGTIDPTRRTALQIVTSGSATTITTAFPLTSSGFTSLTLNQPLVSETSLCLAETALGFGPNLSGNSIPVNDSNDFGRFRTYFIVGLQASNQLSPSSSNTTTAGEYLEGGFNSAWLRARDKWDQHDIKARKGTAAASATPSRWQSPGISTNLDIRLSPIPVAAPQTSTTPATTTSTAPNSLSSQQAVRFVGSIDFPVKLTSWNNHTDFFTLAPMVRGGFGTLINPTSSSTTPTGTSATGPASTSTVVSTQFSSAYSFDAFGARLAWDRYTPNTDEGPQTMTQFLVTFGYYSNLPSYVCKPVPSGSTSNVNASVTTACDLGQYAPSVTTTTTNSMTTTTINYLFNYSRSVIPRVDIEGLAKLPGFPFVLGMDANLQQYSVWSKKNLDYLNKPGNDIRIFVGVTIDLSTLFSSKLGVSGP